MHGQRPSPTAEELEPFENFLHRHVGTSEADQAVMLKALDYPDLDALIDAAVPGGVRDLDELELPPAASEREVLNELRRLASSNVVAEPMIGLGYSGTVTPGVIRRNVLESPAWYTAYTPYQPEISQGRLEALLEFPDDGGGSHGTRHSKCVTARRGHRRSRGGHAHAASEPGGFGPGDRRR